MVAFFAPVDILTRTDIFGKYCDFFFKILNTCNLHYAGSSFPEVATVYFFIIWFSFPFWFFILWAWMLSQIGKGGGGVIFKKNLNAINKVALICLLPIWFFLLYVVVVLYGGGDSRLFALGSSRMQLGLWGMAVPASAAALSSLIVFTIKRVLRG